jgi:hypothetical protein
MPRFDRWIERLEAKRPDATPAFPDTDSEAAVAGVVSLTTLGLRVAFRFEEDP